MTVANMEKRKKANIVKLIIVAVVFVGLIGAVIGLSIQLNRRSDTVIIGGDSYSIGIIKDNGDIDTSANTGIYMRKAVTVKGLKVALNEDANIKYRLFFYDAKDNFVSASGVLAKDFEGKIPEDAAFVRVLITPTDDEDGKVSPVEVLGYAEQLQVRTAR